MQKRLENEAEELGFIESRIGKHDKHHESELNKLKSQFINLHRNFDKNRIEKKDIINEVNETLEELSKIKFVLQKSVETLQDGLLDLKNENLKLRAQINLLKDEKSPLSKLTGISSGLFKPPQMMSLMSFLEYMK